MDYHPFDRGAPFYAYYKKYRNRGCNYVEIAFTGGGTVGHVSVNLSLIPTAVEKVMKRFISVLNKELKER